MPITLGCPSCGKRFRARDESAGKRVKCPYCQAAVPVASPAEAQNAAAPTERVPPPAPVAPAAPPPPTAYRPPVSPMPSPAPVAPAAGWVDESPAPIPTPAAPRSGPLSATPFEVEPPVAVPARPKKGGRGGPVVVEEKAKKTPAELAAPRWKKARAGLWWVLFGLFWLVLPGFVPFGLAVYERSVESIPAGKGWVEIEGYYNDPNTAGTLRLTKRQEVLFAGIGLPVLLGGAALALGRMTCAAVPRSSGAKGLYALSALGTVAAVAGFVTAVVLFNIGMYEYARYVFAGWAIALLLTEFSFLAGLAVCGAALKRPRAPRAVALLVLVVGIVGGLTVAGVSHEWTFQKFGPKARDASLAAKQVKVTDPVVLKAREEDAKKYDDWSFDLRHLNLDDDTWMYKSAGGMIAWLLLIGVYWRAVGAARWAIRDAVERVEDMS